MKQKQGRWFTYIGDGIVELPELPNNTIFLLGYNDHTIKGRALFEYVGENNQPRHLLIFDRHNYALPYAKPEYAGKCLKDIDDFHP